MIKKIIATLITTMLFFSFTQQTKALSASDYNYETELAKFPAAYQTKIKELHKIYPNAVFVVDEPDNYGKTYTCSGKAYGTKLNWDTFLNIEYYDTYRGIKGRSLINTADGYKSTESWSYDYYTNKFTSFSGSNWFAANKQTVAYYLNPLNFLTEKNVFMFESLNYNSGTHNVDGIEKILSTTFMANKTCPGSSKKYSEVIMEAAKKYDISPYFLASRLRQEQGSSKGYMVSGNYPGYTGYYNYFNVKANGSTNSEVIANGLAYAKTQGWDSEYKSIIGGAAFVDKEYVDDGQNTLYLQKWDATGPCWANHQYMQNVVAPYNESLSTYNSYASASNYKNNAYVFYITVWSELTTTSSLPNSGNPNNYLKDLTINGTTISGFDGNKTSYEVNLSSASNTVEIGVVKVANTSSVTGTGTINLTGTSQNINVVVTAENGDKKTYTIKVTRDSSTPLAVSEIVNGSGKTSDGTYISKINLNTTANTLKESFTKVSSSASIKITNQSGRELTTEAVATGDKIIITSGTETKTYEIVIYGDTTGDGKINAQDYVKIKNYIMGSTLTGAYKVAADVDRSNKVNAQDYVKVKNYIMGTGSITQ